MLRRTAAFSLMCICLFARDAWCAPAEQDLPPLPSIVRNVHLIEDAQYSRPQIPPLRTTSDGRIGLQTKTRATHANDREFKFYLLAPEKIRGSFQSSPAGTSILASPTPVSLPRSQFVASQDAGESVHSAICETNVLPRTCGADGSHDCYDFNVVTPFHNKDKSRLEFWRTAVEVEVSQPKTSAAQILSISTQKPLLGASWPDISALLETVMTGDGRLLVGRVAQNAVTWVDAATGARHTSHPNVVYGYIPANRDACDLSALRGPYPITHAHYDAAIRDRYGFGAYPLRDGIGHIIADGADFGGSYAWLDSKGNNLLFSTFRQSIQSQPNFDLRCVGGGAGCDQPSENLTKDTIGIAAAGLWTKGRTILLDNLLNNVDWNLQVRPSGHAEAKLYQGDSGWIHVGSGRENTNDNASFMPPGAVGNVNFIDSVQNKLNAFASLRAAVPRDVAWWVSTGKSTDIVAFDDWINPKVLIDSDMVESIEGESLEPNFAHVQNAATTHLMNTPSYGEIVGPGRIEPVALGGVHGKGFFNQTGSGIRYQISDSGNQNLDNQDWYLGLFIDPRFGDDRQLRRLLEFPDGSAIDLLGRQQLVYSDTASNQHAVALPATLRRGEYAHLGFRIEQDGSFEFFLNGVLSDRWLRSGHWLNAFRVQTGELWLGRGSTDSNGVNAWLDEFKVIARARQMSAEEFCSQASGSLVGVTAQADAPLQNLAVAMPALGRDFIDQSLPGNARYPAYLCYTGNRSSDGWIDLNRLPQGLVSLRHQILFPEGPLVANMPRPDSSNNDFCTACHHDDGTRLLPSRLTTAALLPLPINAEDDPRRQPSQPPAKIYGNIPASLFGPNLPNHPLSSADGVFVDWYLLGHN